MLASKLLGLKNNKKNNDFGVEKMTGVAICSWRTPALFMRAALESCFMIKGPHGKISSLLVASYEKNLQKTQQLSCLCILHIFRSLVPPPRAQQSSN